MIARRKENWTVHGSSSDGPAEFTGFYEYPLYHHGEIGTLSAIAGARYALVAVDIALDRLLPEEDLVFLRDIEASLVSLVPPDGDGQKGYCDLDLAYSAHLADSRRQALALRPDGTVLDSAIHVDDVVALVARIRADIDAVPHRPG
ncbi:hypothetical protein [Nocardia sp. R6R-6]|uniref:hypothetical protein n=1 Tax=Nocardia sp. R6R-6 TaxID=3459303 RepID=UPI00403DD9DA